MVEYTSLVRPLPREEGRGWSSGVFATTTTGSNTNNNKRRMSLTEYDVVERDLKECIAQSFEKFVQSKVACAHEMAKDDIFAMLAFVNWDWTFGNHGGGGGGGGLGSSGRHRNGKEDGVMPRSSPTRTKKETDDSLQKEPSMGDAEDYDFGTDDGDNTMCGDLVGGVMNKGTHHPAGYAINTNIHSSGGGFDEINNDLFDTIRQAIQSIPSLELLPRGGYAMARMHSTINMLVQHVTKSWRNDISQTISTKFNSFCLLPFHEEFESFLRVEIDRFVRAREEEEKDCTDR